MIRRTIGTGRELMHYGTCRLATTSFCMPRLYIKVGRIMYVRLRSDYLEWRRNQGMEYGLLTVERQGCRIVELQ